MRTVSWPLVAAPTAALMVVWLEVQSPSFDPTQRTAAEAEAAIANKRISVSPPVRAKSLRTLTCPRYPGSGDIANSSARSARHAVGRNERRDRYRGGVAQRLLGHALDLTDQVVYETVGVQAQRGRVVVRQALDQVLGSQ